MSAILKTPDGWRTIPFSGSRRSYSSVLPGECRCRFTVPYRTVMGPLDAHSKCGLRRVTLRCPPLQTVTRSQLYSYNCSDLIFFSAASLQVQVTKTFRADTHRSTLRLLTSETVCLVTQISRTCHYSTTNICETIQDRTIVTVERQNVWVKFRGSNVEVGGRPILLSSYST